MLEAAGGEMALAATALADECCETLDEWYSRVASGSGHAKLEQRRLLQRAFRGASAIHAFQTTVALFEFLPLDEALRLALKRVGVAVGSLQSEGCDLSLPAHLRPAQVGARDHWWWRCQEPTFVSGGNPWVGSIPGVE